MTTAVTALGVFEWFAAGTPSAVTATFGSRNIFNGFLVEPGNVPHLVEKIAQLARDLELRKVMGMRSREIAQQELDVEPYVERLLGLYKSLAA